MKLLLTGATGFVGRHLIRALKAEGRNLAAIVPPNEDYAILKKAGVSYWVDAGATQEMMDFCQAQGVNGVIHMASLFLTEHKPEQIAPLLESNLVFATRVLEAAVQSGAVWFINTGTFWQHYQNQTYCPVNLYAATKQAFETLARYYLETSPIIFVTLKLNDTYGPDDPRPKLFSLWQKLLHSREPLAMSPGEQLIDLVHIDDVVAAYLQLIRLLQGNEAAALKGRDFAVSSGQPIKLKDLAKIFAQVAGRPLAIDWGGRPYRGREVMVPWNLGQPVPGWRPQVTLAQGIARLVGQGEANAKEGN